ncbi:PAS domain S-box protein [Thermogemmatispora sp.]|uniref:PAS domain-containing sensor histidine kinase n=1 Tax=Thermogemmatispora sp. TaxID=1968838 RepID=UPI001D49E09C|nr:PAS domain S-box protein [Thermogemmatispora sp.]MBX5450304.1 PAS domain S-box protein [Thermogemmatispora sp.]
MSTFPELPPAPFGESLPPLPGGPAEIAERLRRSEERYRSLVTATAQIVWVASAQGLVEEDSPSWRAYTGQSFEEMRGLGWLEAVHPDDQPGTLHVWSQALASGGFYEIEYRIRRYDGVYRTFWVRGVPVREADGSIREWIGTCTDITDRKRLEDELVQTAYEATLRANQLEATFEAMTDAVFIFDSEGRILSVNAAARRFLSRVAPLPEREMTIEDYLALLDPRDATGQPLAREQWPSRRLLQGEVIADAPLSDLLLRMSNGCERRISVSGSPVRDDRGCVIGAVAIARDVTERYLLERRTHEALEALLALAEALVEIPRDLADSQPRLASLRSAEAGPPCEQQQHEITHHLARLICQVLNCHQVTILRLSPERETLQLLAYAGNDDYDGRWQRWLPWDDATEPPLSSCFPPEAVAALRADRLLGQSDADCRTLPIQAGERYAAVIAPMLIEQQLIGLIRIQHAERGHEYSAEEMALIKAVARLAALVTEHERLLHERAEARANELALRESNRRMDEFLSIASHELRTPLTTIKGNVQLARRHLQRLPVTDEQREKLAIIQELLERTDRQTGLLTRLVRDLLESSRVQADRLVMQRRPENLVVIVRQTVNDLQSTAAQRRIRLTVGGQELTEGDEPPPIMVLADAESISLVVTNYLTNAIKYSPRESPIEVWIEREERQARVSVRDQGPGLPPAEQQRIWERFYRVPGIQAHGSASPGLGLGLHICKTIIERHEGVVGVSSQPGAGSTFWFTLPLLIEAGEGLGR